MHEVGRFKRIKVMLLNRRQRQRASVHICILGRTLTSNSRPVATAVPSIFWLQASTISNQIKRLQWLNFTSILKSVLALLQKGHVCVVKAHSTVSFLSIRVAPVNVHLHMEKATSARIRGAVQPTPLSGIVYLVGVFWVLFGCCLVSFSM